MDCTSSCSSSSNSTGSDTDTDSETPKYHPRKRQLSFSSWLREAERVDADRGRPLAALEEIVAGIAEEIYSDSEEEDVRQVREAAEELGEYRGIYGYLGILERHHIKQLEGVVDGDDARDSAPPVNRAEDKDEGYDAVRNFRQDPRGLRKEEDVFYDLPTDQRTGGTLPDVQEHPSHDHRKQGDDGELLQASKAAKKQEALLGKQARMNSDWRVSRKPDVEVHPAVVTPVGVVPNRLDKKNESEVLTVVPTVVAIPIPTTVEDVVAQKKLQASEVKPIVIAKHTHTNTAKAQAVAVGNERQEKALEAEIRPAISGEHAHVDVPEKQARESVPAAISQLEDSFTDPSQDSHDEEDKHLREAELWDFEMDNFRPQQSPDFPTAIVDFDHARCFEGPEDSDLDIFGNARPNCSVPRVPTFGWVPGADMNIPSAPPDSNCSVGRVPTFGWVPGAGMNILTAPPDSMRTTKSPDPAALIVPEGKFPIVPTVALPPAVTAPSAKQVVSPGPAPLVGVASPMVERAVSKAFTPPVVGKIRPKGLGLQGPASNVVEKSSPVAGGAPPIVEKASTLVAKASTVVEKPPPIVKKASSIVKKAPPIAENASPIVEKEPPKGLAANAANAPMAEKVAPKGAARKSSGPKGPASRGPAPEAPTPPIVEKAPPKGAASKGVGVLKGATPKGGNSKGTAPKGGSCKNPVPKGPATPIVGKAPPRGPVSAKQAGPTETRVVKAAPHQQGPLNPPPRFADATKVAPILSQTKALIAQLSYAKAASRTLGHVHPPPAAAQGSAPRVRPPPTSYAAAVNEGQSNDFPPLGAAVAPDVRPAPVDAAVRSKGQLIPQHPGVSAKDGIAAVVARKGSGGQQAASGKFSFVLPASRKKTPSVGMMSVDQQPQMVSPQGNNLPGFPSQMPPAAPPFTPMATNQFEPRPGPLLRPPPGLPIPPNLQAAYAEQTPTLQAPACAEQPPRPSLGPPVLPPGLLNSFRHGPAIVTPPEHAFRAPAGPPPAPISNPTSLPPVPAFKPAGPPPKPAFNSPVQPVTPTSHSMHATTSDSKRARRKHGGGSRAPNMHNDPSQQRQQAQLRETIKAMQARIAAGKKLEEVMQLDPPSPSKAKADTTVKGAGHDSQPVVNRFTLLKEDGATETAAEVGKKHGIESQGQKTAKSKSPELGFLPGDPGVFILGPRPKFGSKLR